jgi:hypothetical protein
MASTPSARFVQLNRLHDAASEANETRRKEALDYFVVNVWRQLEAHAITSRKPSLLIRINTYESDYLGSKPKPPSSLYVADFYRAVQALQIEAPEIDWSLVDMHAAQKCACTVAQREIASCHAQGIQASWTWDDEKEELDVT